MYKLKKIKCPSGHKPKNLFCFEDDLFIEFEPLRKRMRKATDDKKI